MKAAIKFSRDPFEQIGARPGDPFRFRFLWDTRLTEAFVLRVGHGFAMLVIRVRRLGTLAVEVHA